MSIPKVTLALQAGGKSTRMGEDKSFVLFDGRPMIEHVLARVSDLGDEILLVTNRPGAYAHLALPMIADLYPDRGPLAGIHTALAHARNETILVVACDMPWLNRDLLRYLISLRGQADVVVPRWEKFPEPLHAVYNKNCLEPIQANLEAGRNKITGFFGQVAVRFVERQEIETFDPDGRSFVNVNTPEELAKRSE